MSFLTLNIEITHCDEVPFRDKISAVVLKSVVVISAFKNTGTTILLCGTTCENVT